MSTHELTDRVRASIAQVEDPELPVTIEQLGMIVAVELEERDGGWDVLVRLRPTLLGCPARFLIEQAIVQRGVAIAPVSSVRVAWDLSTPWQVEHVSPSGRGCLEEHGVILEREGEGLCCPYCGQDGLVTLSERGGSLCRRLAYCPDCQSTVDIMGPASTRAVAIGMPARRPATRRVASPCISDHAL